MAESILQKYNVTHIVDGLEEGLKEAKELNKIGAKNEKQIIKMEADLKAAKSLTEVSEETLQILEKNNRNYFKQNEKFAIDITKGVSEATKKQAKEVSKEIDAIDGKLEELEKKEKKLDKTFQKQEDGSLAPSRTGDLYKKQIAPAVDKEMKKSKFVNPFTGKVLTDASNYVKHMDKLDTALDGQNKSNKKLADSIRKKIKEGKELSQQEKKYLELVKKRNQDIVISEDEIIEQLRTKNKLEQIEQKTAEKLYDQTKEQIELERKDLKDKRAGQVESQEDFKRQATESPTLSPEDIENNKKAAKIIGNSRKAARKLEAVQKQRRKTQDALNKSVKEGTKLTRKNTTTLGQATKQVFNYGIAFTALRRIYTETLATIRDLDKALTEMSIVTSMNREESWELVGVMQDLAKETGFTTTEIAKLSTVYFRQGRTLREVIELTRVAAQAARVAGISAGESADFLTSAVNAFKLSADEALAVSDRFAALAASSASSYQELATGLSKFAAQANVAGIGIDFAMGMLAKGVETTREAPETIGTAIKSVTARMRELSDLGKTFEDGMDINRVETALRQVGIALREENGQFRNLEDVLTDVGMRFETMNKNQQASVAVALAGIRQQSRLISIMNNFSRTQELVAISTESAGATMAQHAAFMQGMEAATVQLQTSYQQFITTITESELIIGIVRGLATSIEALAKGLETIGFSGQLAMLSLIGVVGALRAKSPLMKLINHLQDKQIENQQKQIRLDVIERKITIAQNILEKKHLSTQQKSRALQILENAEKEKEILLDKESIFFKKLRTSINELEFKGIIKKIKAKIAEQLTEKGLIATTYAAIKAKILQIAANKGLIASNMAVNASQVTLIATTKLLFAILLANPFTWIVIAIGVLIKGFIDLNKGTDSLAASFASSFAGSLSSIVALFKSLWDALMGLLKPLLRLAGLFAKLAIIKSFLGPLLAITTALAILPPILNLIATAFNFIAGAIQFVINWVEELFSKVPGFNKLGEVIDKVKGAINLLGKETEKWRKASEDYLEVQSKSYDELAKSIKEVREESAAENYELNRKNRSIQELLKEREELEKLRKNGIFGEEELKREQDLISEIRNLDQGEFVRLTATGEIDLELSIDALEKNQKNNEKIIADNIRETAESAVKLAQKDIDKFLQGEGGALVDVQNYLISIIDEDLTEEQILALENYYKSLIETAGEVNLEELAQTDFRDLTEATADLNQAIAENQKGIAGLRDSYNNIQDGLRATGENGEAMANAFALANQELNALLESLSSLNKDQLESIDPIVDFIGFTPSALNNLASILDSTGVSVNEFLLEAGRVQEIIQDRGFTEEQSVSMAIMEIASSMTDGTVSAQLYGLATKQTMLDLVQSADLLSSRFSNLADKQSQFISGELKAEDLYNLIENYSQLFADPEFFEAFRTGGNLSKFLTDQLIEQYQDYEVQLYEAEKAIQDFGKAETEEQQIVLDGLIANRNRLLLLMEYNGELRDLTTTQYEANRAQIAFNRLNEAGLNSSTARLRLIEALRANIGPSLNLLNQDMETINANINDLTDGMANEIYEIVDGVVMIKDGFNDLEPALKTAVEGELNNLDESLNNITQTYKQLMDETIAYEEELAKEKIKVYEDYFAALDRLESRRNIQMDRQSIIEQISRLQGATDEASRKRSLQLQQELNKMNEKSEEQIIKDARQSLIDSVNENLENIKSEFQDVITEWINSGEQTGLSLIRILEQRGLIDGNGWQDVALVVEPDPEPTGTPPPTGPPIDTNLEEKFLPGNSRFTTDSEESEQARLKKLAREEYNEWFNGDGQRKNLFGQKFDPTLQEQEAKKRELERKWGVPEFAKGGMIDYTGLAMLHGSPKKPEAVLNPDQTKIFQKIPDMLASMQSGNGPISIENISISTESLNTNQDFASAGETLAKAFSKAIQRKGVTVNTKR